MKNLKEFKGQKYIIMLIMSITLSCITVYANDKAVKEQEAAAQLQVLQEKDVILSLQEEIESLKEEIKVVKQELDLEQEKQSKIYIAQKDVTAFLETSSYSEVMGTFKAGSVIKVNMITEDGVWIETDQGYVKRIFVTPLEEASNEVLFEVVQPNKEEQKPNKREVVSPKQYKTGVAGKSGLSKQDLDYLLAGSKMAGCSDAVLRIEEEHGVNAFFTISVAQAETQRGLTGTGKSKNNAFGITSSKGGYRYFNSLADSVIEFGGMMKRVYIDKGRNTISKVHEIYTSSPNWGSNVTTIMNKELAKIKAK